ANSEEQQATYISQIQRLTAELKSTQQESTKIIADLRRKGSTIWKSLQRLKSDFKSASERSVAAEKEADELRSQIDAAKEVELAYAKIQEDFAVLQAKFDESSKQSQDEKSIRGELI